MSLLLLYNQPSGGGGGGDTTGYVKYYNGSTWVLKPVKYWNGSTWVTKPLKYWSGSAWVAYGGSTPLVDTYLDGTSGGDQFINAAPTGLTYTFSDITIGAADTRRQVVMFFSTNGGTATTHTNLTANAGAITFTKLIARGTAVDTASTNYVSAWIANVPTGTTLTAPILTVDGDAARCGMAVMTHGRGNTTTNILSAGSGATNPPTGTLDVAANGLAIGYCTSTAASDIIATWDGVTTEHIDSKFTGTGSALFRTFGQYTNDSVADTGKTFSTTWYLASDGVTLTGANFRFIVLAFGATV